jgi:oligopeptide/dipeptide ABC transporter ATP-binding protein
MPYSRALLSSVLYPDVNQERSSFILKGEIPSPINLPSGCFLASRCPLVTEKCNQEVELMEVAPGRRARCIRIQEEGLEIYDQIHQ